MTDLENKFSWSISKDRDFQICKRKYYLRSYGFWEGWGKNADEFARKVYILKQQTTIPMLVGRVVHEAIARAINSLKIKKHSLDEVRNLGIGLFKKGWGESKKKEWIGDPKRKINLFEHYYDEVPSKEKLEEVGEAIRTSLDNFYSSESFRFIQSIKPVNWLSIEQIDNFILNGLTIWCAIDFTLKDNNRVFIYDWKTGKEIKEDKRQLAVYAQYALDKWAVGVEDLRLFDVYLRINTPVKVKVSRKLIDETCQYIAQSASEMKSLLDDPENNAASIENFPMTKNINRCRWCSFKEVCFLESFREL